MTKRGSHLIRYYGWYSNKSRGLRKKAAEATGESCTEADAAADAKSGTSDRSGQSWAMLIKRVYEVDPLTCPECGGQMVVVAFIEPPQADVIEKILQHCGLWQASAARAPPANANGDGMDRARRSDGEPNELTQVDMATFLANF